MRAGFAIAVLVVAIASHAWAGDDRARSHYEQGVRAYNLGRYAEAAEAFQAAYQISGQPGLLFNIAQAFRQQGDCAEALKLYRSFLRAMPQADVNGAVARRVVEMEACVAAHERATQSDRPVPATSSQPEAPLRTREHRSWLPWAFGGAGLALAGSGAALFVLTASSVDDCAPRCSPGRLDDLRLRADVSYVLIGVGAASLVAAGWLWWRNRSRGYAMALSVTPGQVSLWGRF